MLPMFMVPVIFYSGLKFIETFKVSYFYIFSFALTYQFYNGIYIGFFVLIALILVLPIIIGYGVKHYKFSLKSIRPAIPPSA